MMSEVSHPLNEWISRSKRVNEDHCNSSSQKTFSKFTLAYLHPDFFELVRKPSIEIAMAHALHVSIRNLTLSKAVAHSVLYVRFSANSHVSAGRFFIYSSKYYQGGSVFTFLVTSKQCAELPVCFENSISGLFIEVVGQVKPLQRCPPLN